MSVQAPSLVVAPFPGFRITRPLAFRLVPRLETYPWLVSFVETRAGKLVLLLAFGLLFSISSRGAIPLTVCLSLIAFFPARRRLFVALSTLAFTFAAPWWSGHSRLLYNYQLLLTSLLIGFALALCASLWPDSWWARRSVPLLLAGFTVAILLASRVSPESRLFYPVWDSLLTFAAYLWFIGYLLLDRNSTPAPAAASWLGFLRPFWGSTATPFPGGVAFLGEVEARDPHQLAGVQLKGFKLLLWSTILLYLWKGASWTCYEYLNLPDFSDALAASVHRAPFPWFVCWGSTILHFLDSILSLTVFGHRVIAVCRMAGFDALRNTYRPFSSTTVAEFFNRYYFYYKELLVRFFFFPAFLQSSWLSPRLRVGASIFFATCIGNAYFHFMRDLQYVPSLGLSASLFSFQVFFFYSLVLTAGIVASRLRKRGPAPSGFLRGRLIPTFSVCLFFCLLDIFSTTDRTYPLSEYLRYLGHLFSLN